MRGDRRTQIVGFVAAVLPALALPALTQTSEPAVTRGPYLQNATTTTITVCWATAADSAGSVEYRKVGSADQFSVATESGSARIHKAKVTGLAPYTRYQFHIRGAGADAGGSFRTTAPAGTPFRFVAYGDNRPNADAAAAVISAIASSHPDFVVNSRDLVADGTKEELWAGFFATAAPVLRAAPLYPAIGNHERGGAIYLAYFDVPREYSFDYGDVHFSVIDTNRPESEHAAQEAWLAQDLKAHQDAVWRVLVCHHTPCTCVDKPDRRVAAEKLRGRLGPILKAGKVQLVINGHDHDYQHHLSEGIHYLVTGGGGAPLYSVTPDTPFVKAARMVHHFCEISVDRKQITVRALEPSGTQVDSFVVTRR